MQCSLQTRAIPCQIVWASESASVLWCLPPTPQCSLSAKCCGRGGITNHVARSTIKERPLNTEQAFFEHMQDMREGIGTAIDQIILSL